MPIGSVVRKKGKIIVFKSANETKSKVKQLVKKIKKLRQQRIEKRKIERKF